MLSLTSENNLHIHIIRYFEKSERICYSIAYHIKNSENIEIRKFRRGEMGHETRNTMSVLQRRRLLSSHFGRHRELPKL